MVTMGNSKATTGPKVQVTMGNSRVTMGNRVVLTDPQVITATSSPTNKDTHNKVTMPTKTWEVMEPQEVKCLLELIPAFMLGS